MVSGDEVEMFNWITLDINRQKSSRIGSIVLYSLSFVDFLSGSYMKAKHFESTLCFLFLFYNCCFSIDSFISFITIYNLAIYSSFCFIILPISSIFSSFSFTCFLASSNLTLSKSFSLQSSSNFPLSLSFSALSSMT